MRTGRLPKGVNKAQFKRKASYVNGKNLFNPKKLHRQGEIIR